MSELNQFIVEIAWWKFFCLSWISFSLLYFAFAIVAEWLSHRLLPALNLGKRLSGKVKNKQISTEIRYSLISITIFAAYGLLTKLMIAEQILKVNWHLDSLLLPLEIIGLFLWNEFHFYICHRLLHTKWFYKRVHLLHHRSTIPTAYSTYSFHWFEALLLGSVMITAMFIYPFQWLALLTLPLTSITFNAIGHFQYDMFQRASRENPFDLLGGMFIVEGLGNRMAKHWGTLIRDQLDLRDDQVSFLLYHSVSDVNHFDRLEKAIQSDILTMQVAEKVVKTAKVTARLYLLQLEELGNI